MKKVLRSYSPCFPKIWRTKTRKHLRVVSVFSVFGNYYLKTFARTAAKQDLLFPENIKTIKLFSKIISNRPIIFFSKVLFFEYCMA